MWTRVFLHFIELVDQLVSLLMRVHGQTCYIFSRPRGNDPLHDGATQMPAPVSIITENSKSSTMRSPVCRAVAEKSASRRHSIVLYACLTPRYI
jgi:hypothetical protein